MIEIAGLILYTPKDIEDALGINIRIQARYRNKGLLPFRKMGSSIFYTQSDIRDFLENTKISSVAIKSVEKRKDRSNEDDDCNGDKEIISKKASIVHDENIKPVSPQQDSYHDKSIGKAQENKSDTKSNTDTINLNLNSDTTINLNDSYLARGIDDIKSSDTNKTASSSMQQTLGHVVFPRNDTQAIRLKEQPNSFKGLADAKL
ncbi:helix-turn-helix domain-containing protein [Campylobacter sp. RM16192]|uniref:helix-turn-helix domain-containing protein n=1 Tax=Campylobacter sp. RM16192 TaxID=1660080 RepID=UPI0014510F59|nr:helix-turn-helix domain-containing protein [Campylobacter sp. RM16192]QCD52115.1 hypothetical protein CDOMC_0468 [Campylobacter sp. RM16192]